MRLITVALSTARKALSSGVMREGVVCGVDSHGVEVWKVHDACRRRRNTPWNNKSDLRSPERQIVYRPLLVSIYPKRPYVLTALHIYTYTAPLYLILSNLALFIAI